MSLPVAPSNLAAVALPGNKIALTWIDNSAGYGSIIIDRTTNPSGSWTTIENQTFLASVQGYIDTDPTLLANTVYYYRTSVFADEGPGGGVGLGLSVFSNITSATTLLTSASWYYATQQDVIDLLGTANLKITSDLEDADANTTDPLTAAEIALIQRDGLTADAWFNTILRGGAYIVPIVVGSVALTSLPSTDETRTLFRDLSAKYVAVLLNEHRAIQSLGGLAVTDIDKLMNAWKKEVVTALQTIRDGDFELLADASPTEQGWRAGGDATPITPALHNNDVNRMGGGRYPDEAPVCLW